MSAGGSPFSTHSTEIPGFSAKPGIFPNLSRDQAKNLPPFRMRPDRKPPWENLGS